MCTFLWNKIDKLEKSVCTVNIVKNKSPSISGLGQTVFTSKVITFKAILCIYKLTHLHLYICMYFVLLYTNNSTLYFLLCVLLYFFFNLRYLCLQNEKKNYNAAMPSRNVLNPFWILFWISSILTMKNEDVCDTWNYFLGREKFSCSCTNETWFADLIWDLICRFV